MTDPAVTDDHPAQATATPATPEGGATASSPVPRPGGSRRGVGRPSDMVRSLVVVLALVGLVLVFTPRPKTGAVTVVDWQQSYGQAVIAAAYPLYGPVGLPAQWRATSARTSASIHGGTLAWHLGFVTPSDDYAELKQSDGVTTRFIGDMTNYGTSVGSVTIAGEAWDQRFRKVGQRNYRSLVRETDQSAVVVAGDAGFDELAVLAGALRAE